MKHQANSTGLVLTRQYQGNEITFDLSNRNALVNANQMAKPFGAIITHFLNNESTERLIDAIVRNENSKIDNCQTRKSEFGNAEINGSQTENSEFENAPFTRDDVVKTVRGGANPGTWMHRKLAIQFAAWLDVDFQLWILETIDEILFGATSLVYTEQYRVVFEGEARLRELELKFRTDPEHQELRQLRKQKKDFLRQEGKRAIMRATEQINIQFGGQLQVAQ